MQDGTKIYKIADSQLMSYPSLYAELVEVNIHV